MHSYLLVNGYVPILQHDMVIIRPRHAVFLVQARTQGVAWKRLGGLGSEQRSAMHSTVCRCKQQLFLVRLYRLFQPIGMPDRSYVNSITVIIGLV